MQTQHQCGDDKVRRRVRDCCTAALKPSGFTTSQDRCRVGARCDQVVFLGVLGHVGRDNGRPCLVPQLLLSYSNGCCMEPGQKTGRQQESMLWLCAACASFHVRWFQQHSAQRRTITWSPMRTSARVLTSTVTASSRRMTTVEVAAKQGT